MMKDPLNKCSQEETMAFKPSGPGEAEKQVMLLSLALDHVRDAVYLTDEHGRFLHVNDAACRVHGYTRQEMLGMGVGDIIFGYPQDDWPGHFIDLKAKGSISFESCHRNREGCLFPVEVNTNYFEFDGRGHILALARDVTDLKQAGRDRLSHLHFFKCMDQINRVMRETGGFEQVMKNILNTMLSIFNCDRAFLLFPCDPGADTWNIPIECNRPEFPGISALKERDLPVDAEVARTFNMLLKTDGPVKFDPETGNPIPADMADRFSIKSFMSMAVYPKIGKPWEFGVHQCSYARTWNPEEEKLMAEIGRRLADVLTGLLVHQNLQDSERRYRELFENTSDIIMIAEMAEGQRLRLLDFNPACEKTAWFDRDLMIGAYLEDIFTDETLGLFLKQYHACLEKKSPVMFEQEINTAAGRFYIETLLIPVTNARGHIYRMVGICRDITEKRSLETRLLQAQKMEAVGHLAGGIAHDFNNMLMVIMGRAQIAMGVMDPSRKEFGFLQEILSAAERSANLTRQLLGFARQQTIMPVVLDLNKALADILKMLQRTIGEGIKLSWQPCRDPWHVRVDPSQIDQVMVNLCVNARDAIAGTGKITIRTDTARIEESHAEAHPESISGDFVLLSVEDNGPGMDEKTLNRIFEPFFTTKGPDKGTGLGLSTVYGIIRQNNGFIEVSSEPGQGTVFRIYLPRYTAGTVSMPETNPGISNISGHETILLVEDEPAVLEMCREMLETLGYRVFPACAAKDAIHTAARLSLGSIHLLLTDVVMPDMNGRELAEHIADFQPGIRCLFMSGYPRDIISQHGVLDKGIHFIQKPFTFHTLAGSLRKLLDTRGDTRLVKA